MVLNSLEQMEKVKDNKIKYRDFIHWNQSVISITFCLLLFTVYCLLITVVGGCISSVQKDNILAVVDGDPITEGDLEYSLNVAHRREDLSSAGSLDLSEYIQKMVDDRLIIDEARRSGMDQYPEVKQAIEAYILRESVVRLYNDEIVQKVSITDKEIGDYYKKNYEKFLLGLIEVKSEKEAREILERLKNGENFGEIVQKYSSHPSRKDGGEVVLRQDAMSTYIKEAISSLKPGEFSNIIKAMNKYYIVKFIKKEEAPDEELDSVRNKIEKDIRKHKEKERSDEYLKYLRENSTIKIDRELLSSIKTTITGEEREELLKDTRTLVEVDGSILTVMDFVGLVSPSTRKSIEDILNGWIDRKVIDHEALSRHYENNTDLKMMIYRYEDQVLKNTFIKRIIIPQIVITDETLEKFYSENRNSFVNPSRFKIQQITVKTMDEAQEILNNLKNGADFSWLAKRKSTDSAESKGGDAGWFTKAQLPGKLREIIDKLNVGDISPIVSNDSSYSIYKLHSKTEEEVEGFNEVKDKVYRMSFNDQMDKLYEKYTNQLRKDADIRIYDEEVQELQESLQK